MEIDGLRVTVAGAGIGGLPAALLLAGAGAEVTVLERVPEPGAVGAGILLQPNGLAVLYGLGLGDALSRAAFRTGGSGGVADETGRPLVEVELPDFGDGLDHVLALHRAHLHAVLLAAVRDAPRVTLRPGAEVTGAGPGGTVTFSGPEGDGTLDADLVVGADGVHSVVRRAGGFGAEVKPTGRRYLRVIGPGTGLGIAGERWTRLGLFGGAPVGDDTYVFADISAPPVAAALAARDLDALSNAWGRVLPQAGRALARVASFDDLLINEVTRVDCERWSDGRLVLLGDAAHAMAPNLGQGANSAIVDAAVLTIELARHDSAGAALAAYTARRRPAVRRVQGMADVLARLSAVRNPALRRGRDAVLRLAGKAGGGDGRVRAIQQEDPARLAAAVRGLTEGTPAA
jgi:2-polyprenyl-6-methoxyphenol hydroxylase-like FAD-dependent oxidoreductase